ncbi:MAG: ABC transporter ATP-binding protein [Rhodanobacteraceae bacterium]
MSQPLAVECRNLNKRYPHFALRHVDLEVEQGTVMGLVGPNGAGKSTILRMVMGLLDPDSGSVRVLGHAMPAEQVAAKRSIGFVAEDMRLYESETIEFHMEFVRSIFDSWDGDYARTLLRSFDLKKEQKVKGLSHGQRIKATLLLALARRPKLLVFDEPTTGLDPAVRKEVIDEMMNALADEAHSILFSSHNTLDVEQISDYITFIYDGRIIESCNKEEFMDGWRRIRLTNQESNPLPDLPNIKVVQQSGRLCSVTVDHYQDSVADQLAHSGLRVDAVERLTLEEIFLSNVLHAQANIKKEAVS